jgi:Fe-S-cluster containining protein
MENHCNKCGMCCKAISLEHSLDYLKTYTRGSSHDVDFIVDNWTQITSEEALKINPYLSMWSMRAEAQNRKIYFYTCKQFDYTTNSCKCHITNGDDGVRQSRICYGYPLYNKEKTHPSQLFYTPTCGYNKSELIFTLEELSNNNLIEK